MVWDLRVMPSNYKVQEIKVDSLDKVEIIDNSTNNKTSIINKTTKDRILSTNIRIWTKMLHKMTQTINSSWMESLEWAVLQICQMQLVNNNQECLGCKECHKWTLDKIEELTLKVMDKIHRTFSICQESWLMYKICWITSKQILVYRWTLMAMEINSMARIQEAMLSNKTSNTLLAAIMVETNNFSTTACQLVPMERMYRMAWMVSTLSNTSMEVNTERKITNSLMKMDNL